MEVYLNSIEMVCGAQAAAEHWYRKEASGLTPKQAAGIAAILPNPRKYGNKFFVVHQQAKSQNCSRHAPWEN
jgi:monofunctional biosynthetic peptidoglycan transglycosylase